MMEANGKLKIIKRDEKQVEETRRTEIAMLRLLIQKYPEKAEAIVIDIVKNVLTKRAA